MGRKVTRAVDEYIAAHAAGMSHREIAERCGISASTVCRRVRAMREEGRPVAQRAENAPGGNGPGAPGEGTLPRLEELRDLLRAALMESGGGTLARISAEYRATLTDIDRLRGEEGEEDEIDRLAAALAEEMGE